MKTTAKITVSLLLTVTLLLCLVACGEKTDVDALWANATYREDTTIGEGTNTVTLLLVAGEKTVKFTVKTDKAILSEALFENGLVDDPAFFTVCNGITADWNKDKAYWAFYVGEEMASFGINDSKAVTVGEPTYKIVYTK